MKRLTRLTFSQLLKVYVLIFLVDAVLAHLFQNGLFHNLTGLLYGLLLLVNRSECPSFLAYQDTRAWQRGCHIAGGIVLVFSLITRFGI